MQRRFTPITKVFVRTGGFVHDTHAATMLPNFASIALYEQPTRLIRLRVNSMRRRHGVTALRLPPAHRVRRRARVVLVATDTPRNLLLFRNLFVYILVYFTRIILFSVLFAFGTPSCLWRFALLGAWFVAASVFGRERVWGRRFLRRGLLVVRSRASFSVRGGGG